jgi:hypothetical protein
MLHNWSTVPRPHECAPAIPSSCTCPAPTRAALSTPRRPSSHTRRRRDATPTDWQATIGRHARSRLGGDDRTGALRSNVRRPLGTAPWGGAHLQRNSRGRVTFRDRSVSSRAGSATLAVVSTFSATTALPYEHLDRATAGLRAELRQRLLQADVHETPMWDTFEVTGPHEFTDLRGRTWYEYRAAVESRRPLDRTTTVTPPSHVPTESG